MKFAQSFLVKEFSSSNPKEFGYFDVELEPGDVISVPENTNHFFTLMDNREIVAVRLFIEKDGWIAYNV